MLRPGKIEVYFLAGSTNYQQITGHYVTPLAHAASPSDFQFAASMESGSNGGPHLFAIHVRNTASGHPEVYALPPSTNYKTVDYQFVTQLTPSTNPTDYAFLSGQFDEGDGRDNLMAIQEFATSSGKVELTELVGDTGLVRGHFVTPLAQTQNPPNFSYAFRLSGEYPTYADLVAIKEYGTASGKVELYVVKGGGYGTSAYATIYCNDIVTGLAQTTNPPNFQFAMPWESGYSFPGCP
jgi:hypothetical protein